MKKLTALLILTAMLVLLLAGCGTGATTTTAKGTTAAGATTAAAAATTTEKKQPVKLTLWVWDDAQVPATKQMVEAFNKKYSWITVEITSIAGVTDYNAKMQTVIGTKDAPSVFWMNFNLSREYVPMGFVQDLTTYMKNDKSFDITKLNAGITKAYTFDGKYYAVPKDTDSYAVFYNKKLFDNVKVAYPKDTWTIDDFCATAKAMTSDKVIGWTNTKSDRVYYAFMYANGGKIYNDAGTEVLVNGAESVKSVQQLLDLMNSKYAYNGTQLNEVGDNVAFESNLSAMTINGSWMISEFSKALGDNLGIVEMPSGSKGKSSVGHGIGYATTTSNTHMDETWLLLSYLGSDEAQKMQAEVVIPAANACANAWKSVYPNQNLTAFVNALGYSTPVPLAAKNPTKTRTAFQTILANMLSGQYKDAQAAMDAAKAAMDAAIKG